VLEERVTDPAEEGVLEEGVPEPEEAETLVFGGEAGVCEPEGGAFCGVILLALGTGDFEEEGLVLSP